MIDILIEELRLRRKTLEERMIRKDIDIEEARNLLEQARSIKRIAESMISLLSSYIVGREEREIAPPEVTEFIAEDVSAIIEKIADISVLELIILAMAYSKYATPEVKRTADAIKAYYRLTEEEVRIILNVLRGKE